MANNQPSEYYDRFPWDVCLRLRFHVEYNTWCAMHTRCRNSKHPSWGNYGGRGIAVCRRWTAFEAFLGDMGPRPSDKYSIDRINNDGNYEPGNCRWATRSEQQRNKRRARKDCDLKEQTAYRLSIKAGITENED